MLNQVFGVMFLLLIYDYTLVSGLKQQHYNPNTDFLLHESGLNPPSPKRDHVASPTQPPNMPPSRSQSTQQSSWSRDYASQFPSLGPTTPKTSSTLENVQSPSSGKRDYVAPQNPGLKPSQGNAPSTTKATFTPAAGNTQSSSGKRDYVAPQFPALRPTQGNSPVTTKPTIMTGASNSQSSSGKRDYVAPQYPALGTQGKVKDLINFYDGKGNKDANVPSYSSILQGGSNKVGATTTKPSSFSAVAAGSSLSTSMSTMITTPKTGFSLTTPQKPTVSGSTFTPTLRPGSTSSIVLPSSIVNKNPSQTTNSNTATDSELKLISEELLSKDTNNAARLITVNYQGKTTSHTNEDKAPLPLLTISPEVWNIPTVQKLVPLLDNYERDTLVNEYVTPQERNEENAFLDAIMSTTVIRHLMNFLKDKGYVTPDPRQQRDFLKQMWFGLYSRGKGKISSSGFEHVFLSELKNGEVIGLHNWIYFAKEEEANRVNYMGYIRYTTLNDKGVIIKLHMNQQGVNKPVNTLFIGTSPELDIALYTLCFVTRAQSDCKLKLGGNDVDISTHTFRYRSKNYIGAAYPN